MPDTPSHVAWGSGRSASTRAQKVKGQFFTPAPVVEFMFRIAGARAGQSAIDPACGDGAFLAQAIALGCDPVVGVDSDPSALALCRQSLGESAILLEQDGLMPLAPQTGAQAQALPGAFDLVIGNPPFNSLRHGIDDPALLSRFVLGRKAGTKVRAKQRVEVLFLEQFVRLARPEGTVCVVLPDGLLANAKLRYVREFLVETVTVLAVVSLPRSTFAHADTSAKTSILLLQKRRAASTSQAVMASVETWDEWGSVAESIESHVRG